MSLLLPTYKASIQRLFDRLERVSEWQLLGFSVLWVVAGGMLLQLVVLPLVVPFAHWGHGLIAYQDSVGFHIAAAETAERIRTHGWSAWEFTPTNYSIALASAIYALTYSEPWVVLPVNGILFGIVIVAVRQLLAVTFDSRATGLVALAPFLIFPSFVPIWGQLYRDLNTGAGFSLVLCGLVLATRKGPGSVGLLACVLVALAGTGLVWLSRSYAMSLIAAGTVAFVALALLSRRCERLRVLTVGLIVLLVAASSVVSWMIRAAPARSATSVQATTPVGPPVTTATPPPASTDPKVSRSAEDRAATVRSWIGRLRPPRIRYVDASVHRYENCLPTPTRAIADRLLYNLCVVREGFVMDATNHGAGSGYDYDVGLRTAGDFIAYGPRAAELALLEPGPQRWLSETTTIGKLGSYFVPFEMLGAYTCFLLAVVFAGRRVVRPEVLAVIAFCVIYTLFYVFATPQLGTVYRMRAFAFAILVSTALAAVIARFKEPLGDAQRSNVHDETVRGFGDEWRRFDQSALSAEEKEELFEKYFGIFPFSDRSSRWEGFDAGCGSGRWASLVALRVKTLHLIDASAEALAVAKANLKGRTNCEFHHWSLDHIQLADCSMDFGYSLGVLHHVPDTAAAMAACVKKLKPGAPFLVYVYYALDNRPRWFRALWRTSDGCRRLIARMPYALRYMVCNVIAAVVYWPLARIARLAKDTGRDVRNWPLSFYADRSLYVMRTDALDRFGTRLEQRFSRTQLETMMRAAGLRELRFSPTPPFWCAVGYRTEDVAESGIRT